MTHPIKSKTIDLFPMSLPPTEMSVELLILSKLDVRSLITLAQVSREYYKLARKNILWLRHILAFITHASYEIHSFMTGSPPEEGDYFYIYMAIFCIYYNQNITDFVSTNTRLPLEISILRMGRHILLNQSSVPHAHSPWVQRDDDMSQDIAYFDAPLRHPDPLVKALYYAVRIAEHSNATAEDLFSVCEIASQLYVIYNSFNPHRTELDSILTQVLTLSEIPDFPQYPQLKSSYYGSLFETKYSELIPLNQDSILQGAIIFYYWQKAVNLLVLNLMPDDKVFVRDFFDQIYLAIEEISKNYPIEDLYFYYSANREIPVSGHYQYPYWAVLSSGLIKLIETFKAEMLLTLVKNHFEVLEFLARMNLSTTKFKALFAGKTAEELALLFSGFPAEEAYYYEDHLVDEAFIQRNNFQVKIIFDATLNRIWLRDYSPTDHVLLYFVSDAEEWFLKITVRLGFNFSQKVRTDSELWLLLKDVQSSDVSPTLLIKLNKAIKMHVGLIFNTMIVFSAAALDADIDRLIMGSEKILLNQFKQFELVHLPNWLSIKAWIEAGGVSILALNDLQAEFIKFFPVHLLTKLKFSKFYAIEHANLELILKLMSNYYQQIKPEILFETLILFINSFAKERNYHPDEFKKQLNNVFFTAQKKSDLMLKRKHVQKFMHFFENDTTQIAAASSIGDPFKFKFLT